MKTQRRAPSPKRARSSKKRRPVKVWLIRDPEVLRVVFQIFDDLTALRRHCAEEVESAREVEYVCRNASFEPDHSGLQRWSRLSKQITACWGVFDDLVQTTQLNAKQCRVVYRGLMSLSVAWEYMKGSVEGVELIDQTTRNVRAVLIAHAQWHGQRGKVPL
ncbi:MAG: hypothetical protein MRJ68_14855 [Nitrospira sp.]|nr:hypothetical protein [Nitrospira sp.]